MKTVYEAGQQIVDHARCHRVGFAEIPGEALTDLMDALDAHVTSLIEDDAPTDRIAAAAPKMLDALKGLVALCFAGDLYGDAILDAVAIFQELGIEAIPQHQQRESKA